MATRASWKGHLKIDELSCAVGLYSAVSSSDRISLNIVNRKTHNRVERQFVDSETGKPVGREDQVKGYRLEDGDYIIVESDELASIIPDSDKIITVKSFISAEDIDKLYFDKPYYLAPADSAAEGVMGLIAETLRNGKVAALAHAVLFRRYRTLLVRPHEDGLIATMLNFEYEVRSAEDAFKDIPEVKATAEMLDLANHIISTKRGTFEPADYEDRYEAALVELVKAKVEGKPIPKPRPAAEGKVIDLMQALRESAGVADRAKAKPKSSRTAKSPKGPERRRKAS
ncbi:Ku protein [Rhizobium tubonense]|uniref:Non-homologous end joining protein Ku n=1 Tax=Rhizobium tubonense TaxID=484088 RepID=A0A2W4EJ94_9HYPH|nr:Ku protein [Rhizobium tubonense]PZM11563.1 Ku protein [Rhizobium tubonense]